MRPSTIWYTLKQGIKNIKRNFMFSIASIITMAACIFLFGIFFSIVNNVNTLAHKVEEDVPITVLFNEGTTQEQMDAVGELIRQRPEVSKIEFESGDEAWEKMKQEYFGDDSEAADGFKDDNPLANSSNYRVYMNNIEKQSELVAYIKTLDNVREVNQSEQAAKTLGSINRIVSYVSVAVIVILLLIAIFLISNTISVGITVRKDEIGIMKYIGATDSFVRAPFLLEGDRIESMLTGPELLRLYVWKKRVMRRGCVNKTLFKSVHREDVWLRSLKQDSEEDRTIVLKNEWAEKKWKMMHAGEVEVEEKESEEKDGEEKKEVKEEENEKEVDDSTTQ